MLRIDDDMAVARLVAMTNATRPETRKDGVWRITERAQRRRSAPARLLPLIRPLLDDPDEAVRSEVVHAFRRCGRAAVPYADDVARVAARYPRTAGSTGFTPEYYAVGTLMLLGDARWVDPVCAATPADTVTRQERQVLAARLVWMATGDPAGVLPTLRAVLGAGGWPALSAAGLVADLADARVGPADLVPLLRTLLKDPLVRADAARALWRLGEAPSKLAGRLVDAVEEGWHHRGDPISALVEMGAVEAIPRLEKLANRDRRVVDSGVDDDIVWDDEALRVRLRAAVEALRSSR